jgi:hypothetical protein
MFIQGLVNAHAQAKGEKSKIRINSILPGVVWTNFFQEQGLHTQEDHSKDPLWSFALSAFGGYTPMDKLVDKYVKCIEDETLSGTAYVVGGEKGEPKKYPESFDIGVYVSANPNPGASQEVVNAA